jgi:pimeloyl-ACP methyl ester carboxylesterase
MMRLRRSTTLVPALALFIGASASLAGDWTDTSSHQIRHVGVAPGIQLEVLDWGGSGDALVFLAGLAMNAHTFDDFAPRFIDTHRVVGITRRGHGASSWPDTGYSLERLVEDIRIVLDALGIERAILAGNSMAGSEMTRFASDYPERIAALVYIDAAHDGTLIEQLRIFEVCPTWPETVEAMQPHFENPEAFRRTQMRQGADGSSTAHASETAIAQITALEPAPVYSTVLAPALAIYHMPRWAEDVFGAEAGLSMGCLSAIQRYIYESVAGFAVGMARGRIVGLEQTRHLIHLVSPDALEEVMRRWLGTLEEK